MKKLSKIMSMAFLLVSLSMPAFAGVAVVITTAPPPAIVEAVPVAPGPAELYVWRPGYYRWVDERHVWIPGHWAKRPHPGAEWVAPRWEQGPEGYRFNEGYWK